MSNEIRNQVMYDFQRKEPSAENREQIYMEFLGANIINTYKSTYNYKQLSYNIERWLIDNIADDPITYIGFLEKAGLLQKCTTTNQ